MTALLFNFGTPFVASRPTDVPSEGVAEYSGTTTIQRIAGEPIRNVSLTFQGIPAGTEVRITDVLGAAAADLAGVESSSANPVLSVPYYGSGQTVWVTVVHLTYGMLQFELPVPASDSSIPFQLFADRWYNNP